MPSIGNEEVFSCVKIGRWTVKVPIKDSKLKLDGIVTWVIGGADWHGRKRNIEGLGLKWVDLSSDNRIVMEVYIEEKFKEERLYSMLSP